MFEEQAMKKNTSFGLSLILIVILGLVAALPIIVSRVGSEQRNNSAEVLFDYAALNDYARRSGVSVCACVRSSAA